MDFSARKVGTEAVDPLERRAGGLDVELTGLRQVCVLAEVVGLEESACVLTDRTRQDGCVDLCEVPVVKEVGDGLLDFVADLEAGALLRRAEPEVSVIQQELDAMFLGLNRVLFGNGSDFQIADPQLKTARRTIIGFDLAGHRDHALLRQGSKALPRGLGQCLLHEDALDDSGAIPHDRKGDLAVSTRGFNPPLNRDRFTHVGVEIFDFYRLGHRTVLRCSA